MDENHCAVTRDKTEFGVFFFGSTIQHRHNHIFTVERKPVKNRAANDLFERCFEKFTKGAIAVQNNAFRRRDNRAFAHFFNQHTIGVIGIIKRKYLVFTSFFSDNKRVHFAIKNSTQGFFRLG